LEIFPQEIILITAVSGGLFALIFFYLYRLYLRSSSLSWGLAYLILTPTFLILLDADPVSFFSGLLLYLVAAGLIMRGAQLYCDQKWGYFLYPLGGLIFLIGLLGLITGQSSPAFFLGVPLITGLFFLFSAAHFYQLGSLQDGRALVFLGFLLSGSYFIYSTVATGWWPALDLILLYASPVAGLMISLGLLFCSFQEINQELIVLQGQEKSSRERLENSKNKIKRIHHVALQMSRAERESEVYQQLVRCAEQVLSFDYGSVGILEGDLLKVKANSEGLEQVDLPREQGVAGKTLRTGKTYIIEDAQTDEEARPVLPVYRGAISIPIGTIGVFQAVSEQADVFGPEDVEVAEILVAHGLQAINRIRAEKDIRYMSFHDSLTGLYNRSFLEQELNRLDTPRQLPLSIIMGDVNGLKLLNDTYGHATGDKLLQKTAELMKGNCRQEDILARWGGDEFLLLLPQTGEEEARALARRIEEETSSVVVETVPLSISLGSATRVEQGEDILKTLNRAEKEMYRNKLAESQGSRNRVLQSLLKNLQEKSQETEEHIRRMGLMAGEIGREVGLMPSEMERLELLVKLHDIGKIALEPEILNKGGKLSPEEWELIKSHPETGYRIARSEDGISHIAREILAHHEWWDGSGYPQGLQGEEIPLLARINAIVDAYEVMTAGRPYQEKKSQKEAMAELRLGSGTQFDPDLVQVFLDLQARKTGEETGSAEVRE